jgi:YD repeat-containing protein
MGFNSIFPGYSTADVRLTVFKGDSSYHLPKEPVAIVDLPPLSPKNPPGCPSPTAGNPINIVTGNKFTDENDYQPAGSSSLQFTRHYNSSVSYQYQFSFGTLGRAQKPLGMAWVHNYYQGLAVTETLVTLTLANGQSFNFKPVSGTWKPDADVNYHLQEILTAGIHTGWKVTTPKNTVETYNAIGDLLSITDSKGLTQTLTYSCAAVSPSCPIATPTTIAPYAGLLIKVTDSFNRSLNFTYGSNGRISTLTDPNGNIIRYSYIGYNLSTVTYPDDTPADLYNNPKKTYIYGELANTANVSQPNALTGIIDENGNRYATYSYDAQGRGISTEHAGGAQRVSLAYNTDGSTTVTDALGAARTYRFQTILGVVKPTGQSQPGGSGCGASASAMSYDANGNVSSRADFNGNRTDYSYDLSRNLETSRTEGLTASGATTPATRTITTVWHTILRLPVQVTNGNQQTTYAYNPQGEVTEKTITDTATQATRTWTTTYTYGAVPGVLVQKVEDGPRTDVADVTTYAYYPADASCAGGHFGCRGQLQQVTDALGHTTRLPRYNVHGQVEELIDANGLVTTLAYDTRQRLLALDRGGETTTYSYDPVGQLTRVTGPDGAYLAYSYDAAHRLTQTQDNLGNTVTYTLDALGNRIKEEAHDPSGQLARSQTRVYDALSRLQNLIQPQ